MRVLEVHKEPDAFVSRCHISKYAHTYVCMCGLAGQRRAIPFSFLAFMNSPHPHPSLPDTPVPILFTQPRGKAQEHHVEGGSLGSPLCMVVRLYLETLAWRPR